MLELVDTHCHIHFPEYQGKVEDYVKVAISAGVAKMVTVGTNAKDSQKASDVAQEYPNVWFSAGLHPHDAKKLLADKADLLSLIGIPKLVAIGECGLDYYYLHSSKEEQVLALRWQIEVALEHKLPVIFHVRDAFKEFWPIFDSYQGITGVFHCFTGSVSDVEEILARGLYIGVNGIATFTKKSEQLQAYKIIPLNKLMLETDAPFLTPAPLRGTINESKNIALIAEFLGELRGEKLSDLASVTTSNIRGLFNI
jgi:TatD DNase family protein